MGVRSRLRPLLMLAIILLPLILFATGCVTDDPFNARTDRGTVSDRLRDLFYPVFFVAVFVFFAVEGLLLFTIIRFRRKANSTQLPVQTHGNTRLEVGWTIVPSIVLAIIAVPTISTLVDLSRKPADALEVRVIARQWWWEFQYDNPNDPDPSNVIYAANELHIPAGRKIYATIESEDVIHSFWVPNLAGKQDAIPGRKNNLTFDAVRPGVYQGECAEFCLDSHALMRFIVVAEPQADFDRWLAAQAQPGVSPSANNSVARGQQLFMGQANAAINCFACHAVNGASAAAAAPRVGPNLTHVGSRITIGANRLENTPENLVRWIKNPQAYKPGAKMPAWEGTIPEEDIKAIADYLQSLK